MKNPLTSEEAREPVAEWINRNSREMKIFWNHDIMRILHER
jgi:hypothetical protein